MKIPGHMKILARDHHVRDWVKTQACDTNTFFKQIATTRKNFEPIEVPNAVLAGFIGAMINEHGTLDAYCARRGVGTGSAETWAEICESAGWTILEMYAKAIEEGTWSNE